MNPIFSMIRQIDAHAQMALTDARNGGSTDWVAEMQTIGRLSAPANNLFDGAGLRDCG